MDFEADKAIIDGFPISAFISKYGSKWRPTTIMRYRKCLYDLLKYLDGQNPTKQLVSEWGKTVEKRYMHGGQQPYFAAVNHYFQWCHRPDLLVSSTQEDESERQPPEITRSEYLELLRYSKAMRKYRTYLLIKLFVLTGVPYQCLNQITVDFIEQGCSTIYRQGKALNFRCPDCLQYELLLYAQHKGISSGPIFITRTGKTIERTVFFRNIKEICRAAGIAEEKGSPSSLRRLYQVTQQNIQTQLADLHWNIYSEMLENEQAAVGLPVIMEC